MTRPDSGASATPIEVWPRMRPFQAMQWDGTLASAHAIEVWVTATGGKAVYTPAGVGGNQPAPTITIIHRVDNATSRVVPGYWVVLTAPGEYLIQSPALFTYTHDRDE